MFLSKSDFINLCKSMGKDPEFEKLRAEVLSILKKQAKTESNGKDIHKSLLEMDKSFKYFDKDEFIIKSGYPVGTIREWKGRKYIKVAPNKWKPKYDSESKGAKNSITRLMKQVERCKNVEELMNLVMENKQRFTDANGNHLPIVDKLRAAADWKNEELSGDESHSIYGVGDNQTRTKNDYAGTKNKIKKEDAQLHKVSRKISQVPTTELKQRKEKLERWISNKTRSKRDSLNNTIFRGSYQKELDGINEELERRKNKKESPKGEEKKYSYDGEKDRDNIISKLKNNELVHPMTGKTMDVTDAVLYDEVKDLSEEERNKKLDKVISDAELNFKKNEKKYKEKKESYEYMRNSKTYSNSDSETRARSAMVTAHTDMAYDLTDIVIAKKIKSELKESESGEKKESSSKKKTFEQEMDQLNDAQDEAWEGFDSGSDIKATPENSKKFYERVKKFVDDNNIKLSKKHRDEIEENNGHSFNEALALAGAYGAEEKEKALARNKEYSKKYKGSVLDLSQIDEFKENESEAEKHKNRSDAMKGNKNAYKGYLSEEKVNHVGKMNYEVYEERNTDKDVFAAHHKDGQFKGISMNQDIAEMIDTMKPGFDGEEVVAKEIHEKYPAVKESYVKQMLRYISMGVGKSRKPARVFVHDNEETKKNDETKGETSKVSEKKESKTSTKASNNTSSAYAPSESTDLGSKTVIASNKSIGDGEVEMPYSKELDAEIKSLNNFRSTDTTRKAMNSVYYDNGNLVTTDGRRMKTIKVGELDGIANGSYVDVTSGKDGVKIKVKEVTDVDGNKVQFPSYDKVIPTENEQKVSLDNNVLKDKLKTMLKDGSIDKKVGRVALEFRDDGVFVDGTKVGNASNIKLKSGMGFRNDGVDTNNIFVNANYLLDALTGNESTLMLSDNAGKAMSIGTGSTNNIIMPMNPVNDTDPNKLPDYEAGRKAKNEENESKVQRKAKNKKAIEDYMNSFNQTQEQIDKIKENIKTADETVIKNAIEAYTKAEKKFNNPSAAFSSDAPQLNSYGYRLLDMANKDPEFAPLLKEAAKKYGIEVRKSLFDDLEEDYEEEFVEKSNGNVFQRGDFDEYKISDEELMEHSGSDLFESVNIAETVRSVLSEII